jgi:hypothetical protein
VQGEAVPANQRLTLLADPAFHHRGESHRPQAPPRRIESLEPDPRQRAYGPGPDVAAGLAAQR